MSKGLNTRKAVALFMVLATILVVVVLASAVLALVLSQTRLTKHKATRIQAYYAAQAIANYAIEKMRTGVGSGAWLADGTHSNNEFPDDFPPEIKDKKVEISSPGIYGSKKIKATVDFTYTP